MTTSSAVSVHPVEAKWISTVRRIVNDWMGTFGLRGEYPIDFSPDADLDHLCYKTALAKGYPVHASGSLAPYLSVGVNMSATAFAHLQDTDTRVWIALYTAFITAADDLFSKDAAPVKMFLRRMLRGERQDHPALDGMADVLAETAHHFDAVQDALILTSSLNLLTALPVENLMTGVALRPCAAPYARWSALLSGATEAYALFVFPRGVPFRSYGHAIPEMMTFIRLTNDILSFYKEELVGDTVNQVSLVAQCKGIPKVDACKLLADECAAAHLRVVEALRGDPAARAAWLDFASGYIGFHAASKRYRLGELRLTGAST